MKCDRPGCEDDTAMLSISSSGHCICNACLREMKIKYVMMRENNPEEFFKWFMTTTRKGKQKTTHTDIEDAMVERHGT